MKGGRGEGRMEERRGRARDREGREGKEWEYFWLEVRRQEERRNKKEKLVEIELIYFLSVCHQV